MGVFMPTKSKALDRVLLDFGVPEVKQSDPVADGKFIRFTAELYAPSHDQNPEIFRWKDAATRKSRSS
jgi:hypothetical protein